MDSPSGSWLDGRRAPGLACLDRWMKNATSARILSEARPGTAFFVDQNGGYVTKSGESGDVRGTLDGSGEVPRCGNV